MQNLRDKLLKAGLVTQSQVEEVQKAPTQKKEAARRPPPSASKPGQQVSTRPANSRPGQGRPAASRPTTPTEVIPRLPPLALPGSKAFQRLESLKQLEQDKRLREMVRAAEVPVEPGEHRFYFMTRKGKLRRLELTEAQAKLLEEGKLAVVERPEPALIEHSLVPKEVAEQLLTLSQKAVRFYNREGKPIGFLTEEELAGEVSTEPETPEATAPSDAEGTADRTPT